jgi:hypothetical protein
MSLLDRSMALIVSHGPYLWALWLVAAFLVGRWGGIVGVVVGRTVTAAMVVLLDFQILYQQIQQGSAAVERGIDWAFVWHTAMHVILINTLLLPLNVLGWWMWKRNHKAVVSTEGLYERIGNGHRDTETSRHRDTEEGKN